MKILGGCRRNIFKMEEKEIFSHTFLLTELPLTYQEAEQFGVEDRIRMLNIVWKRIEKTGLHSGDDPVRAVWYEPRLRELLDAGQVEYPLDFLLSVYKDSKHKDKLILRDGGRAREFAWEVAGELNMLTVYTDNEEDWEEFAEKTYEDSGLILQYNQSMRQGAKGSTVFIDFDEREFQAYRSLPEGTLYIDLAPTKQKRRILQAKRKDIVYCDYAKFLDTDKISTL